MCKLVILFLVDNQLFINAIDAFPISATWVVASPYVEGILP